MRTTHPRIKRGHRSVVYRPGAGWSGSHNHWHVGRQPAALRANRHACVCPLTVTHRRRPGLRTKTLIVSIVAVIAGLLTIVLTGAMQL